MRMQCHSDFMALRHAAVLLHGTLLGQCLCWLALPLCKPGHEILTFALAFVQHLMVSGVLASFVRGRDVCWCCRCLIGSETCHLSGASSLVLNWSHMFANACHHNSSHELKHVIHVCVWQVPDWTKDNAAGRKILQHHGMEVFESPIHLEGGSIHTDGEG